MTNVKSYAAFKEEGILIPFDFNQRDLTQNDVLIDIIYCGVCHSDIHQAKNEWGALFTR